MRKILFLLNFLIFLILINLVEGYKRVYEGKYVNTDIPEWKQKACEMALTNKANAHYICDEKNDVKCLPGWQGDLCQVPMCRKGCDPMNGYCQRPGECRCRIGYTGEFCDKCIPLPGCQHGYCTKPFECLCQEGWDGLFCTEPTCRQGCHNTRGYCEAPNECRCRLGWTGRNCSECAVMPGCQNGVCQKPLECKCLPGYTGLLCQTPICDANCHKQRGYCRKPGECRCKVGWMGEKCDKCFPYPGCVNGDCERPWECNCLPGWGGMLCNETLTYCAEHASVCENGGTCISLTQADGSFRCQCRQGYLGKQCEILDEFLLTSTAAPRITPPPPPPPLLQQHHQYNNISEDKKSEKKRITTKNSNVNTLNAVGSSTGVKMATTTSKTTSPLIPKPSATSVNLKINEVQNGNIDHDLLANAPISTTPFTTSLLSLSTSLLTSTLSPFLSVAGSEHELKKQTMTIPTMNVVNKLETQNPDTSKKNIIEMNLVTVPSTATIKNVTKKQYNEIPPTATTDAEKDTDDVEDEDDEDDEFEEYDEDEDDESDSSENVT